MQPSEHRNSAGTPPPALRRPPRSADVVVLHNLQRRLGQTPHLRPRQGHAEAASLLRLPSRAQGASQAEEPCVRTGARGAVKPWAGMGLTHACAGGSFGALRAGRRRW